MLLRVVLIHQLKFGNVVRTMFYHPDHRPSFFSFLFQIILEDLAMCTLQNKNDFISFLKLHTFTLEMEWTIGKSMSPSIIYALCMTLTQPYKHSWYYRTTAKSKNIFTIDLLLTDSLSNSSVIGNLNHCQYLILIRFVHFEKKLDSKVGRFILIGQVKIVLNKI